MNKRQYKKKIKGYHKIKLETFAEFQMYNYCMDNNITVDQYLTRTSYLLRNKYRTNEEEAELDKLVTSYLGAWLRKRALKCIRTHKGLWE